MILNFSAAIILARVWWAFVLRGILAIAFGVIVLLVPTIGLVAVVAMFAAWAIIGGATELIGAWRMRGQRHWWVGILEGLAGLAVGVLVIFWPLQITALALLYVVAAWAIVTGILQVWLAIRMREQISGELLLGVAGVVSVIFGLVLVINPGAGLLSVLWLVGIFAIAIGATFFLVGLRLRRIFERAKQQGEYVERGI
ncbi:MAG TPA: HdeD family acid-resistance protein [Candidatus Dormibacteraeota bacterium]|nr:HdeD family acid-resistance protein [Candidatus Dormibacteraeota bacterium]